MSAILTMWMHPHHAPSATSYPLIEFLILVCKFMHSILLWTSLSMYWLKWHRKQHKHINGNDGDDATAYHWEMEDFYFTNICESTGNHNIVIIYSSSNYCIFFPMTSVRRTKHNIYWYVFSRSSALRALFCIITEKICYLRKNWIQ